MTRIALVRNVCKIKIRSNTLYDDEDRHLRHKTQHENSAHDDHEHEHDHNPRRKDTRQIRRIAGGAEKDKRT